MIIVVQRQLFILLHPMTGCLHFVFEGMIFLLCHLHILGEHSAYIGTNALSHFLCTLGNTIM